MIKSSPKLTKDLTIIVRNNEYDSFQWNPTQVPIFGAIYSKICLTRTRSWQRGSNIDAIKQLLEIYGDSIRTLTFDNFNTKKSYEFNFSKVTRWEILGIFEMDWIPNFDNLTHLIINVKPYYRYSYDISGLSKHKVRALKRKFILFFF